MDRKKEPDSFDCLVLSVSWGIIGAAIKKSGLTDPFLDAVRHMSGMEKILREIDDRLDVALHKLGMDLHGKNLTREQQNDRIRLTEELNDYTEGEFAELVKLVQNELPDLTDKKASDIINVDSCVTFLPARNMKLEGKRHLLRSNLQT